MAQNFAKAYPYGKALFTLAKEEKSLDAWGQILLTLSNVAKSTELLDILQSPELTHNKQKELLTNILLPLWQQNGNEKQATIFLELLLKQGRFAIAPEIAAIFAKLRAEEENFAEGIAKSAVPLSEKQQQQLKKALENKLGKKISLQFDLDEALLGGIKVKIGDTIFDGTVANQLKNLRQLLSKTN